MEIGYDMSQANLYKAKEADTATRIARAHEFTGRDLTRGGLHRAIWYLAPAMMLETGVMSISQVLDTYWVGRLGSAALAAVTISITVRWVVSSMANGLGIGGMAVVARRIGAKDQEAAEHAAWQTILLGIGASLVLGALGLTVAKPLLTLLGADAEVLPLGLAYLRVAFAGVFTLILSFIINAMLRGAGADIWAGPPFSFRDCWLCLGVRVRLWGRPDLAGDNPPARAGARSHQSPQPAARSPPDGSHYRHRSP
jgi:hypothetical protein